MMGGWMEGWGKLPYFLASALSEHPADTAHIHH